MSMNALRTAALCFTILSSGSALAQTRFQWPDTTEHFSHYTNIENCLAADVRVSTSIENRRELTEWQDTLPKNGREQLKPQAPQLTQSASQCAEAFSVAKVDPRDYAPAMQLFLAAGRDSDAATIVERWLAAVPVKNAIERGAIVDSAVLIYVGATPLRLASAEDLLLRRAKTANDRIERFKTYATLLWAADRAGDSARAVRAARLIVGVADSLTVAERQSDAFERMRDGSSGLGYVFEALNVLTGMQTRLDSLRKSTASYIALERAMWPKAGEGGVGLLSIMSSPFGIGEHASTLTADFWYPGAASSAPHPGRGHPSLVLFLDHTEKGNDGCILGWRATDDALYGSVCAYRLAEMHRLASRFPNVEIDIVMATHGQFMYLPPTSPAEEAALIKQLIDTARIPGAILGVTSTPFSRLPDPDSRRIDKDLPNFKHYTFEALGMPWAPSNGSLFLVDSDGLIVDSYLMPEDEVAQFIQVLLERDGKESHQ